MSGWFKIHRKMKKHPLINKDPDHLAVWMWLLYEVEFEPRDIMFKGKIFTLNPGQTTCGINLISSETKVNRSKVYRILKSLENETLIEIHRSSKCSLVTVVNWGKYQQSETQSETQVKLKRNSSETQVKTSEEYKNKRTKEYKDTKVSSSDTCVQRVVEEWNSLSSVGVKSIKKLSSGTKRYESLIARVNQYGVDEVINAINEIRYSSFLRGGSAKGWCITFDWFVLPNNFIKVLEGNYRDADKLKQEHSDSESLNGGIRRIEDTYG